MPSLLTQTYLLVEPTRAPFHPASFVLTLGATLVVAPHPDDESLACGGLLALLSAAGRSPRVLVITDGSKSHPHSASYPASRLAALRERETLAALKILGLPPKDVTFLRYPDSALPRAGTTEFREAAACVRSFLISYAPQTLLVPWRRDPHCDHIATWEMLRAAVFELPTPPRWLEYPVWAWTRVSSELSPRANEADALRIDITSVMAQKEEAIARHQSQLGTVIDDDPEGFVLQPEMLAHFAQSWELFLIPFDV